MNANVCKTGGRLSLCAVCCRSLTEFDLAAGKPGWTFAPPDQPYPEPAHLAPGGVYFSANRTMWRRNNEGAPEISVRSLTATPYWTADGQAFTTTPELRLNLSS